MKKMKESHKWEDIPAVYARCPHCGRCCVYQGINGQGDIVGYCKNCGKAFKLGRQR